MTEVLSSSQVSATATTAATTRRATATADGPAARRGRHVPRAVGFWLVALTTTVLLAASSAPSPLYSIYQQRFGFSAVTLTVVFAVYVVALLLTLLTVGRLSDVVGRRPVLAAALVVEAGAMAIFLGADGVGWLLAARIVQGVATGAAMGVLAAYLLDLQPVDGSRLGSLVNSVSPTTGLAIGSVLAGTLVQYGPDPSQLVFRLLGGLFVVLALLVAVLPETVRRVPGVLAALRPRIAVPPRARGAFVRATPVMIATWAIGGLVLSIGGSVLAGVFGVTNHATVGLVLAVLPAAGALGALALRDVAPGPMTRTGTVALVVGAALVLASLLTDALWLFVVAAVVAGVGFGVGFLGALRSLTQLAAPHERAALLSAVFVVSYVGFSIPAVVAGILVTQIGLLHTAVGYSVFVAVVALATLAGETLTRRHPR